MNIVILGAGQAAASMAAKLRAEGHGGSITVIGDEDEAIRVGEQLNAVGIWINDFDTMGGVSQAEKTAFGASGLGGSRYGPGGFMRFMRKKALVIRSQKTAA